MKKDIILAGVGGQGILSIAAAIGHAALAQGLNIKQAEVHGMSQRGGDVHSNLRISSKPIHSDLIPRGKADIIIALEPMEALRYMHYLAPDGWVVANSAPVLNIAAYPEIEAVLGELRALPRVVLVDADSIAKQAGAPRGVNMAVLGAAAAAIGIRGLEEGVSEVFGNKGEAVIESNIKAFKAGLEAAKT